MTGAGLGALEAVLVSCRTGIVRSLTRFRKAPREPEWPRIIRAELANSRYRRDKADAFQVASGKGMDEASARISALGEAVERYSGGIWQDEHVTRATRTALDGLALDPRTLPLYPAGAYASLPYTPYDDATVLGWVWGRDLGTGTKIALPAQPALMGYALGEGEGNLCQVTSNGLAAGPTLAEATLRAAYEVIERDAFIATWLLRLPGRRIDIASLGDPAIDALVQAYHRRGVGLELYRLSSTTAVRCFVGLGIAETPEALPAVVIGLGADHDPLRAAQSALMEVAQVRPGLKYRLNDPEVLERRARMLADPMQVTTLEDHDLYYSGDTTLGCFDFLRSDNAEPIGALPGAGRPATLRLRDLTEELSGAAHRLCAIDLTPPDMARLGLHTARVFIPGYQPIYFGQSEMRLAEDRLAQLARVFGAAPHVPGALNPNPHPLA